MRCRHIGPDSRCTHTHKRLIVHAHFPWFSVRLLIPNRCCAVGRNRVLLWIPRIVRVWPSYAYVSRVWGIIICATRTPTNFRNRHLMSVCVCVSTAEANMCSQQFDNVRSRFLRMHNKNWNESISSYFLLYQFARFKLWNIRCAVVGSSLPATHVKWHLHNFPYMNENRWVQLGLFEWCVRRKCMMWRCTHMEVEGSGNKLPK